MNSADVPEGHEETPVLKQGEPVHNQLGKVDVGAEAANRFARYDLNTIAHNPKLLAFEVGRALNRLQFWLLHAWMFDRYREPTEAAARDLGRLISLIGTTHEEVSAIQASVQKPIKFLLKVAGEYFHAEDVYTLMDQLAHPDRYEKDPPGAPDYFEWRSKVHEEFFECVLKRIRQVRRAVRVAIKDQDQYALRLGETVDQGLRCPKVYREFRRHSSIVRRQPARAPIDEQWLADVALFATKASICCSLPDGLFQRAASDFRNAIRSSRISRVNTIAKAIRVAFVKGSPNSRGDSVTDRSGRDQRPPDDTAATEANRVARPIADIPVDGIPVEGGPLPNGYVAAQTANPAALHGNGARRIGAPGHVPFDSESESWRPLDYLDLLVDESHRLVRRRVGATDFTIEFRGAKILWALFMVLAGSKHKPCSRKLLKAAWNLEGEENSEKIDGDPSDNVMNDAISDLRKKLVKPLRLEIKNMRSSGWWLTSKEFSGDADESTGS
jgi:hypothetical protein